MCEVNFKLRGAIKQLEKRILQQILDKVTALQENRGVHKQCATCPLQLTCVAGRNLGYFCVECCCFTVPELDQRILCDAVSPESTKRVGFCLKCDSGVPMKIHEGVVLLTSDERDRLHMPLTNLMSRRIQDDLEALADQKVFRELDLGHDST